MSPRKPPTRRYAERTKVPESKSRREIEDELHKHRCDKVAVMTESHGFYVAWVKGGRSYRMGIELPPAGSAENDRERRRRLRTLNLYVKGRLNAVEDGIKSFEAEFMPEVILDDGRTLGEHAYEQLGRIESAGRMPAQLMLPGGSA